MGTAALGRPWRVRWAPVTVIAGILASVALALAWLVFPYSIEGRQLLKSVGSEVKEERRSRAMTLGQFLTRGAVGSGQAEVSALYAIPAYFEAADRGQMAERYRPDSHLVFLIDETTHTVDLPFAPPRAELIIDGRAYLPTDVEGPEAPEHHRLTVIRFARFDAEGRPILGDETRRMELFLTNDWADLGTRSSTRSVAWDLPLAIPGDLLKPNIWSPVMVMALSAGLLSAVLTPCLLQLVIVFMVTITGLGAHEVIRAGAVSPAVSRRVLLAAAAFVLGFTALFAAAGAGVGYAGNKAQIFSAEWARPVSITSGLVVIAIGIWVGIRARAPVVCRIAVPRVIERGDRGGLTSSALVAAGMTLGCLTCFSGAIIAALFIYVGALGSALIGATVLTMFSLGVAIPFLAAAALFTRVMPLMTRFANYAPQLGFASMVVIVSFGLVMVTDNFHTVSNFIYPWLGLG